MFYPILIKDEKIFSITDDEYEKIYSKNSNSFNDDFINELKNKYINLDFQFILPKSSNNENLRWTSSFYGGFKNLLKNNDLVVKNGNIFQKVRPDNKELLQYYASGMQKSFDYNPEYANASTELKNIFNKEVFDFPKPISLIQKIIQIATNENSIILDSFAGSGTTAHAVLELNKKDGGNRKFILVEMENYAENITAERVRRVIDGYGKEPKTTACGGDFSFYELGERLLLENGNINENVATNKIKEYIYFSETKQQYRENSSDFLGQYNGVAYYFIYKKDEITTLDFEYLANIKKASAYVIYADICVLSNDTMMKYSITFKKIPRDIKRV